MLNARLVASTVIAIAALGCAGERKSSEPPMQPASYDPPPATTQQPKGLPPTAPADDNPITQPGEPEAPDTMGPQAPAPPQ
ncbi:MAG TPA: hypothetical protein VFZ53_30400 [Polyangiaceae bacterium]